MYIFMIYVIYISTLQHIYDMNIYLYLIFIPHWCTYICVQIHIHTHTYHNPGWKVVELIFYFLTKVTSKNIHHRHFCSTLYWRSWHTNAREKSVTINGRFFFFHFREGFFNSEFTKSFWHEWMSNFTKQFFLYPLR